MKPEGGDDEINQGNLQVNTEDRTAFLLFFGNVTDSLVTSVLMPTINEQAILINNFIFQTNHFGVKNKLYTQQNCLTLPFL
ncbi:hypothetical protein A7K99_01730 [Tatumella citrea]|uniref:Uncharacterized protein n=1 Tax=Tatumella citrea TaxID=53336 RepID=A0A1Y0LGK2_TATCI|nr:hypothetical protein A7K98_01730 [Tatumella citrea]ARU96658.1 hypothetical protein A7K99_01730 [Tatumella citrea]